MDDRCEFCAYFKRTSKARVFQGKRFWRGKCKKYGNDVVFNSLNKSCDSFDGNEEWIEKSLTAKGW